MLDNWSTASFSARVRAMLGFLQKLSHSPEAVNAGDVKELHAAGITDLAIMDVPDYREIPYFFGVNHCRTVITKGRVAYQRMT